jgi:hypothetical protein
MAADVATLSLKLEASQFVDGLARAKAATEGLTRAETELVAKADKLVASGQSIDIQNKKAVQTYLQEVAAIRATAQQMGALHLIQATTAKSAADVASHEAAVTAQMRLLRIETGLAEAQQRALGAATGMTAGGLNAVRASAQSLVASLVGAAPGVAQLSGALGTMALGSGMMIGVLAGMAALGFAWQKWQEHVAEGARRHKEAMESIRDEIAKTKQAMEDIAVFEAQKDVERAQRQLAAVREARTVTTASGTVLVAGSKGTGDQKALAEAQAVLDAAIQRRNAVQSDGSRAAEARYNSDLATLIQFNQATDLERKNALARLRAFEKDAADLQKSGADNAKRIFSINEADKLRGALFPKSGGTRAATAQDTKDVEAITALLREQEEQAQRTAIARTKAVADAGAKTQQELAEQELLLAAITESEDAYKAQQREIAVLNQLTAEGVTLADADYDAKKRVVEALYDTKAAIDGVADSRKKDADAAKRAADEIVREQERADRQRVRQTANAIEQIFTDIANRRNPLLALVDGFKSALIRALSEALAQKFLASKFAALLGIGVEGASKKQVQAGAAMVDASIRQKEAAEMMLRAAGFDPDNRGEPKKSESAKVPSWVPMLIKGTGIAIASGYAGYQTGQAMSSQKHGTMGNLVRGGLGGAASGAMAGFAIGGPIGAIAGAGIGFVAGLFGASKAMKEAAKQARELRAALSITMAGLRAEVGKDALAASIAQVEAQREQIRRQIEEAYQGGDRNSATVKERNRQLAELNRLEDERIRQLKEEAAVMQTRQTEDFRVRELRAQGKTKEADAMSLRLAQQREREDLVRSFGTDVDDKEKLILAALDAALAAERNASALDRNTAALTRVLNAPSGYKVEADLYQFRTPAPRQPRMQPTAPQFSGGTKSVTLNLTIDGTKTSREQVKSIASELRKVVTETLGKDAETSAGWDLLA